jgi:hypothetical protein
MTPLVIPAGFSYALEQAQRGRRGVGGGKCGTESTGAILGYTGRPRSPVRPPFTAPWSRLQTADSVVASVGVGIGAQEEAGGALWEGCHLPTIEGTHAPPAG